MQERLAILGTDIGEDNFRSLQEEFPQITFMMRRKGEERLDQELLARAEIFACHMMSPSYLNSLTSLKYMHAFNAGVEAIVNHVPADARMSNGAGAYGIALGEHVLALLLGLTRSIHLSMRNTLSSREWKLFPMLKSIAGSHVAILGTGDIGNYVANAVKALGAARITGMRRRQADVFPPYDAIFCGETAVHDAVRDADFVIVCLPGTAHTRNLVDTAAFQAMKPGAVFINIGRGNIVNTQALMDALDSGQIAAAGLDVTEPEPLPADHPLWDYENVIITTHYAGWSTDMRLHRDLFAKNLHAYLEGKPMASEVNREFMY